MNKTAWLALSALILLILVVASQPSPTIAGEGSSWFNRLLSPSQEGRAQVIALNYALASLNRIVTNPDIATLDHEYDTVFNNMRLDTIKDAEVVKIILSLTDAIHEYKLEERYRTWLRIERERVVSTPFYASFSPHQMVQNAMNAGVVCQKIMDARFIATIYWANAFRVKETYRQKLEEIERKEWDLDTAHIKTLHNIRKEFLKAYWEVLTRYTIADTHRMTEKDFVALSLAIGDEDPARRLRRLLELKDRVEAYPPVAFYTAAAALASKDDATALRFIKLYEDAWAPVLQRDQTRAFALMTKARLAPNRFGIRDDLIEIKHHSGEDLAARLFTAGEYERLGMHEEAAKILQANLDQNIGPTVSARMLAYILAMNDKKEEYQKLVIKLLSDETSPLGEATGLAVYYLSPDIRSAIYNNFSSASLRYMPGSWFSSKGLDLQLPARLARTSHSGLTTSEDELEPLQLVFLGNTVASRSARVDESKTRVSASFPYNFDKHGQAVTIEVKVGSENTPPLPTASSTQPFTEIGLEFRGKRIPVQQSGESEWSFDLQRIRGDGFCFKMLGKESIGPFQ